MDKIETFLSSIIKGDLSVLDHTPYGLCYNFCTYTGEKLRLVFEKYYEEYPEYPIIDLDTYNSMAWTGSQFEGKALKKRQAFCEFLLDIYRSRILKVTKVTKVTNKKPKNPRKNRNSGHTTGVRFPLTVKLQAIALRNTGMTRFDVAAKLNTSSRSIANWEIQHKAGQFNEPIAFQRTCKMIRS